MPDFHFSSGNEQAGRAETRKKKIRLFLQGIFVLVNMFFYFMCVKKTCFSIAILLEYTAPIYVMLASPFVLKEKVGKESIAALFLAMAGVYLVISPNGGFGTLEFSSDHFIGIASGLFAGLSPCSCHYERKNPEKRPFRICNCLLGNCYQLSSNDAFCF